ncbi:hypothetical protein GQ457_04G017400 [Hibiscus cannabinus]
MRRGVQVSDKNNFFNSSHRRTIRLSIRKSLEEVDGHADSEVPDSNTGESNILKEALAIFDVSQILGVSFEGGKEALLKRVCEIEEESRNKESKLADPKPSLWRKLWHGSRFCYSFSPSNGSAGGLICFWDSDFLVVSNQIVTERYITLLGTLKYSNLECGFLNLYGPAVDAEKGSFFSNISDLLANFNLPWCVCGDFNMFLHIEEKLGGSVNMSLVEMFRNFIQITGLVDLPLKGGTFTWSNLRDPPTLVRLDRFLVSLNFLESFQALEQLLLGKSLSDHNAIALINMVYHWGQRPFKFFNYHLDDPGFVDMVSKYLLSAVGESRKMGVQKVLKRAKGIIKDWYGSKSMSDGNCIASLEKTIFNLEWKQAQGLGDSDSNRQIVNLRGRLWEKLRIEERAWLQKSRLRWSSEAPRDKKCVYDFFCKAYNESNVLEVDDLNFPFSGISHGQHVALESAYPETEIWRAIFSSDSNKAPGPDGFNMGFFKKFWPQLKGGHYEKGNPETLEDYRPISLVGGMYKILSKVLANRLKLCMDSVISSSQFAFIQGRQILDCSFIANECIDDVIRRKSRGVVFKIDFRKAYDSVYWGFLIRILKEMNFGSKWCDWIYKCVSSATISVLVNGTPTDRFSITRGLRQGCSLSPLLFNIVGEALHQFLTKATESGLFTGFMLGSGANMTKVSHLQFANDLMIFCDASFKQVVSVKRVLRVFELASCLQLNLKKCRIFGINIPNSDLEFWANEIGCSVGKFPAEYLGLPLGPKKNMVALWDPVVEKFEAQLASWKSTCLSYGGRVVLLKCVLSSLPIYYMSLFKMLVAVYRKLSSLMANFLWGSSAEKKKIH